MSIKIKAMNIIVKRLDVSDIFPTTDLVLKIEKIKQVNKVGR